MSPDIVPLMDSKEVLPYLERRVMDNLKLDVPQSVFLGIRDRILTGLKQYGPIYPGKCDWKEEIRQELRDAIAYAEFSIVDESVEEEQWEQMACLIEELGLILGRLE